MAKGPLLYIQRGKLGNTVLYKVTNSRNKVHQGEREYVADVANPQTEEQAAQRLKMTPALNFYHALKDEILNHSWEGIKYGGRSYARFMRVVMSQTFSGQYPFVPKNFADFVPGQYPLAAGSLISPKIIRIYVYNHSSRIQVDDNIFPDDGQLPWASWLDTLYNWSDYFREGDQITVVAIRLNASTGQFVPVFRRIILRRDKYPNATTAADVFNQCGLIFNDLLIYVKAYDDLRPANGYGDICAVGIIVSRPLVSKTSNYVVWQRSTSELYLQQDLFPQYFTQEAYERALESYQGTTVDPSSAWYLNQGTTHSQP